MMSKETFKRTPMPLKVIFFISVGALYIVVFSGMVYFLWNAILPKVSPLKEVSYFQAMGILALSKILFSSMKFGGRTHHHKSNNWKEKWHGMSNMDKEEMKARWKGYCEKNENKEKNL